MNNYMKEVIENKTSDFTIEERNLLSVSFKNLITSDRKALKLVNDIAAFEKFSKYVSALTAFRKKLQRTIITKCTSIISLCENECLQLSENTESRVFFHKIIADYYRYAAETCMYPSSEFKTQYEKFVESAKVFYLEGLKMAASDLDPCNPVRLGIVLNLSVFYKEISDDLPKAILITEHALQNAVEKIDDIG
jgi:14-3-3 protein epsilon